MPRLDIHKTFMNIALQFAELSYADKLKVGCILVNDQNIIATGYNGMPKGFDNTCEDLVQDKLITKPEVLHAESNAIAKCSRSVMSSEGCTMYVTHAPCISCAKLIVQAGITEVYYLSDYKRVDGLELLIKANITIKQIDYEIN